VGASIRIDVVDERSGRRLGGWSGIPAPVGFKIVQSVESLIAHLRTIAHARSVIAELHDLIGAGHQNAGGRRRATR
jgi:hypothetical protein